MFPFVVHSLQAFSLSDLEAFSHIISKMEYFRDREAVLAARRSRLAARVASYGPQPDQTPQSDLTQEIAKIKQVGEQKQEVIEVLVDLVTDAAQLNSDLKLECQNKQDIIDSLIDVLALSNPSTTVQIAPLD